MVATIEEILGLKFVGAQSQAAQGRKPSKPSKEVDYDKPSILPFSFVRSVSASEIVGHKIFAKINGDDNNDDSDWVYIYLDDDGDLSVNVPVESSWIDNPMFFEFDGALKSIPLAARKVDAEDRFTINVDGFVSLNSKLSALMKKVDIPKNARNEWHAGKYHSDGKGIMKYRHEGKWIPMLMPIDDTFVEGIYEFV